MEGWKLCERNILLTTNLYDWEENVICCLVGKKDVAGHCLKQYLDTFGRMVEIVRKQLIGNVDGFVKHRSLEEGTVEENGRGNSERERW